MARTRKTVPVHNLKVTRRGKVKKRMVFWRMRRAFYLAALAVTVGVAGLIFVLGQVELPVDPKKAPIEAQTSFICSAEVQVNCNSANAMAQLHGTEDRVLVTYDQIPAVLRDAVVSAEDRDFFDHDGVDPMGIARAAYRDIRNEGVRQGGSTITQQYVKQAYLNSEQTITRKVKEAVMAVKLEQEISKEEILTRYLNTVYFGRGAYGVQAASRTWFGHDVEALDAGEAAFLAGLLRNPNGADPYRGADLLAEAERRRSVVLEAMEEEGYITAEERKLHLAVPMDPEDAAADPDDPFIVAPPKASVLGENVKGRQWGSEYFAEHVRKWLVSEFGTDTVYGGGLKVYTTLDLDMQKAAYETVTSTLNTPGGDPAAAIVALDDRGHLKAMMGGTDFANNPFNLATSDGSDGRQAGSTFKTFVLADAVRKGYSIRSVLPSPPQLTIDRPECTQGGGAWEPKGGPGGSMNLVNATKRSTNTVFAELMVRMTPKDAVAIAEEMGVRKEQPEVCALVLGAGGVSVLDMAAGYSTLANQGIAKSPIVVTRVEFPDGRVKEYAPDQTEVLTREQAGRVTYALQQVIDGGTGKAAAFGRPAAGKTGTSQKNVDAWFVGYTPKLTAAVWMGYPTGSVPMSNVQGREVTGGSFPAEMWRQFMDVATADFDTGEFPEFDAEVLGAGEPLDPTYGTSGTITSGSDPTPVASVPAPTAPPATTAPPTTAPPTTAPPTTAPPTTAPPTTAPPATVPSGTAPGAQATGSPAGREGDG
jgi:penicillin-binding protein 1A